MGLYDNNLIYCNLYFETIQCIMLLPWLFYFLGFTESDLKLTNMAIAHVFV